MSQLKVFFLVLFLFVITPKLYSQNFSLSRAHIGKLNEASNGRQRVIRYYRYFRRDSLKNNRLLLKKYRRSIDSAYYYSTGLKKSNWFWNRSKQFKGKEGLFAKVYLSDSISKDSMVGAIAEGTRGIKMTQRLPYDSILFYVKNVDYPDHLDSGVSPEQFKSNTTLNALSDFSPPSGAGSVSHDQLLPAKHGELTNELPVVFDKATPHDIWENVPPVMDEENIKSTVNKEVIDKGKDYFIQHGDAVLRGRNEIAKLLKKYREFSSMKNSDEGIKRASLKGKTLKEHLLIGCNFNIPSVVPLSIDFSPQVGYKFNKRCATGVALNYRFSFADSIASKRHLAPTSRSYRGFVTYEIIKSFFTLVEFERSKGKFKSDDRDTQVWKNAVFAGLGKRFLIHPKLYMTITTLYNLNFEKQNAVDPRRFQVRFGFQISELAMRKKLYLFDPNK
jgi:hypothetical protein